MPRVLQIVLMWLVTLAWVANLIIGWLAPALGQQAVNAAFMLVLAILLRSLRRNKPGGNDDTDEQTPAGALDEVRQIVGDAISGTNRERKAGDEP